MSYFVIDCESDGPVPPLYSLVCFGAVKVDEDLDKTFYGKTRPISDKWNPEALAISEFSREEHESFDDPEEVFKEFVKWVQDTSKGHPVFLSDNPCYDWQWINYYCHKYMCSNPFGFSGRRIGDLFCGFNKNLYYRWKRHRKTVHDHNPVNDAKGNAEAFLHICKEMKVGLPR